MIEWTDTARDGVHAIVGDLELYIHPVSPRKFFVSLNGAGSSSDDVTLTSAYAKSMPAAKARCERMAREWVARQAAALGDGWIPVGERLPVDRQHVIVLAHHPTHHIAPFYSTAYYHVSTGRFHPTHGEVTYNSLTHWRHLPPLPPEVKE